MPKTAVILLNYNDGAAAVQAAERIRGFKNIDTIILADNASTDDSVRILEQYVRASAALPDGRTRPAETVSGAPDPRDAGEPAGRKTASQELVFLQNQTNGGYGPGNNRGVEEAVKRGCEYALIANSDAVFTEETVEILQAALEEDSAAAAGALMEGRNPADCAWPLLPFWKELAFAGPLTGRIFRKSVRYPDGYFTSLPREAGAVHGSLFLVKTGDFMNAGGFDERMFLFCEEKTLGQRIAKIGKKIVLTGAVYGHAGSETLKKAGMSAVRRQKERQRSERCYYRQYLGAGPLRMLAVYMEQGIVLAETAAAQLFGRV